jgi:hypothetical protein
MSDEMQQHWREMEQAHSAFTSALGQFLSGDKGTRLQLITEGYKTNPYLVITVLRYVAPEEIKELLPFLLSHARSVHGYLDHVQQIILRLPKNWLVEHIEAAAEPFLKTGTYDDYRRFLELYFKIDSRLTERLARRAASSSDPDIREAGEDFLEKLVA